MSQPLKPGENEIAIRLIVNDRDYDDLEAYAKILGKTLNGMLSELCPLKLMTEKALESYRSARKIAVEEYAKGKRGDELDQSIKRRFDKELAGK